MLGAIVKSFFAERESTRPGAHLQRGRHAVHGQEVRGGRPEMGRDGRPDIDAVLTTRELAELIRMHGLDLAGLAPEAPDTPFGERTSAGKIFGASGGVAEAALRTAHFLLTGEPPASLKLQPLRGLEGVKEYRATVGGREIGVAAVSSLGHARALLEQVRAGRRDLHFIEVMTLPGRLRQRRRPAARRVRRRRPRADAGALHDRPGRARCARRTRTWRSSASTRSSSASRCRPAATSCCTRGTRSETSSSRRRPEGLRYLEILRGSTDSAGLQPCAAASGVRRET